MKIYNSKKINAVCITERRLGLPASYIINFVHKGMLIELFLILRKRISFQSYLGMRILANFFKHVSSAWLSVIIRVIDYTHCMNIYFLKTCAVKIPFFYERGRTTWASGFEINFIILNCLETYYFTWKLIITVCLRRPGFILQIIYPVYNLIKRSLERRNN